MQGRRKLRKRQKEVGAVRQRAKSNEIHPGGLDKQRGESPSRLFHLWFPPEACHEKSSPNCY